MAKVLKKVTNPASKIIVLEFYFKNNNLKGTEAFH